MPASGTDAEGLPPLPAKIATLIAIERNVPPPGDALESSVWAQIHLEITREGFLTRVVRRLGPEAAIVVAFLFGVGAVIAVIYPRSEREGPNAVIPLSRVPETPDAPTRGDARERPVPLVPSADTTPTSSANGPTRSPVLVPATSFPILPPFVAPAAVGVPAGIDGGRLEVPDGALPHRAPNTLIEENILLDIARNALTRHRPNEALDVIRMHIARFPNGQLIAEREALAVIALEASGHRAEASERAEAFLRAFPDAALPANDLPRSRP